MQRGWSWLLVTIVLVGIASCETIESSLGFSGTSYNPEMIDNPNPWEARYIREVDEFEGVVYHVAQVETGGFNFLLGGFNSGGRQIILRGFDVVGSVDEAATVFGAVYTIADNANYTGIKEMALLMDGVVQRFRVSPDPSQLMATLGGGATYEWHMETNTVFFPREVVEQMATTSSVKVRLYSSDGGAYDFEFEPDAIRGVGFMLVQLDSDVL